MRANTNSDMGTTEYGHRSTTRLRLQGEGINDLEFSYQRSQNLFICVSYCAKKTNYEFIN